MYNSGVGIVLLSPMETRTTGRLDREALAGVHVKDATA